MIDLFRVKVQERRLCLLLCAATISFKSLRSLQGDISELYGHVHSSLIFTKCNLPD